MRQDIHALSLAMCALGLGWNGHIENDSDRVACGLQLYSAAVGELRKNLTSSSVLHNLSTMSLLALYELCEFGSEVSRGWITHLYGIGNIFQTLGPMAVAKSPYWEHYSFYRIIEVRPRLAYLSPPVA